MASGGEVLSMLLPNGGWYISGNEYESIKFIDCDPITKEQYEAGFAEYDAWKAEQESTKTTQRQAILDRLGITADEAKLLLS